MKKRILVGLGLMLLAGACTSAPTEPVVIISQEQFEDFERRHKVSSAIGSVESCSPGTAQSLYNKLKQRTLNIGGNLVVLDEIPKYENGSNCYRGVAYSFR